MASDRNMPGRRRGSSSAGGSAGGTCAFAAARRSGEGALLMVACSSVSAPPRRPRSRLAQAVHDLRGPAQDLLVLLVQFREPTGQPCLSALVVGVHQPGALLGDLHQLLAAVV